ncbi:MAG: DUF2804 domain-containing protein [Candidatus Cryosericum sp.]
MGEYTEPCSMVTDDGLVHFGWARQPLFEVNMAAASSVRRHVFRAWRLKRWEYFFVVTPTVFFAAQVAHVGYLGNLAAYLYDIKRNMLMERTANIPFGTGVILADHPRRGTTSAHTGKSALFQFQAMPDGKHVTVNWPRFNGPDDLHADLTLGWPEPLESLTVVDPLRNGRFAYTTKVICMPATGTIRVGQEAWECNPGEALGELDWSRGFLESVTPWKWATASGRTIQSQVVGFNLCSGFHDGGDNENAVVVDGRLTKLGLVSFTYDHSHIMQPWRITSSDNRIDLSFVPMADRQSHTAAGPLQSHIHQLVGRYSGTLMLENRDPIAINDFVGAAEDHYARW